VSQFLVLVSHPSKIDQKHVFYVILRRIVMPSLRKSLVMISIQKHTHVVIRWIKLKMTSF